MTLQGDAMLLRRLVRNLLDNARVHGGGATLVRVEQDAGRIRLLVEDGGGGVNAADHDKIFEPFYRAVRRHALERCGVGALHRQTDRARARRRREVRAARRRRKPLHRDSAWLIVRGTGRCCRVTHRSNYKQGRSLQ